MSAMILALMMMAQSPAAVPPAAAPPVETKKRKPKQVCQTVEVTGSRVPQRICRNADDPPPMEQGLTDAFFGIAKDNVLGKVGKPPL